MAYDYRHWLLRVQERSEGVYDALDRANLMASAKNLELNCSELKLRVQHTQESTRTVRLNLRN